MTPDQIAFARLPSETAVSSARKMRFRKRWLYGSSGVAHALPTQCGLYRPDCAAFPIGRYVIFYRVTDDEDVFILRVLAGSRDLDTLL